MPLAAPTQAALEDPAPEDKTALERMQHYQQWGSGYAKLQSTRPQSIGYALTDSPMGQAAWFIEKFYDWSDCNGVLETTFTKDELLDNVMQYWWTASGASSARLYWESMHSAFDPDAPPVLPPAGCSVFPKESLPAPRSWMEKRFKANVYWNELARGGHFAAFEQPALFIEGLRRCFGAMRL